MTSAARALAAVAALAAAVAWAAPAAAKGKALAPGERVDVNRASVAELMRLPGVGRKRAEAIAALRDRRPFRKVDDLSQVKGISPAWVQKNRGVLDASGGSAAVARPPRPAGAAAAPTPRTAGP